MSTPELFTIRRELDTGAVIDFEEAPAGSLTASGDVRLRDYRAYYWTPQPMCLSCRGSGRAPSEKRPDGTIKCQPCKGSGECKRERKVAVSTVLDSICPKPGLPIWSEARGIEGAFRAVQLGELVHELHDSEDAVKIVRLLRLGADRARDDAAERGLNVHACLEEYMRSGKSPRLDDHPVEHHGYVSALASFLVTHQPEPLMIEELVCNPSKGYAGRSDLVAMVDGFRVRFDAKTSEKGLVFESAHIQVRLYEQAGVACGDEPSDLLQVVVFAADGTFRLMACHATDETAQRALDYYEAIKPITSACEGQNRIERELRRVLA